MQENPRIGFIGFGEVAYAISKGLKGTGIRQIIGYNRATYRDLVRERARGAGVELVPTLEELVGKSELIISAVWGANALEIAKQAAGFMTPEKVYVDLNNAAPSAKEKAAQLINARGARFVDVALLSAPKVDGHKSLMYASGDGAEEFRNVMTRYGMNIDLIPGKAGAAMTIKALWQVLTKGTQALIWELLLAAQKAGVDMSRQKPFVVNSPLGKHEWSINQYTAMHAGLHAERKSGELRELAGELREWGIDPVCTEAAAKRLEMIGKYKLKEYFKAEMPAGGYQEMVKAIVRISQESKMDIR